MTTTPPHIDPNTGAHSDDDSAWNSAKSKAIDRAVKQGGIAGIAAGAIVTLCSWGLIPGLDHVTELVAGIGGFLNGFTIPLAVLALLLPFLEDGWAVRWLEAAARWKRAASTVASGVHEEALNRPRVAAAAAGYILVVQLMPVVTEYRQDDSLEVASVPWTPAAGLVSCLVALILLHMKGVRRHG